MNAKVSLFVTCLEAIIHLLLYNLHDCTFNRPKFLLFINRFNVHVKNQFRVKYQSQMFLITNFGNSSIVKEYLRMRVLKIFSDEKTSS